MQLRQDALRDSAAGMAELQSGNQRGLRALFARQLGAGGGGGGPVASLDEDGIEAFSPVQVAAGGGAAGGSHSRVLYLAEGQAGN
eukprot:10705927-Alexandrium_andersonii.AAC.1